MEFILEAYNRDTPDEKLLSDIKNVALKLKKNTVSISEYESHGKFHPSTLQRRFGSWFKVLELAKLEASRSKLNIPEKELFKNIEEIWIALGRQPKYAEIKKPLSKYSAGTYDKRFGSWLKALQEFVVYINSDNISDNQTNLLETEVAENTFTNAKIKHKTKREISDRLRFKILMRDGFTCKKCGKSPMKEIGVELHIDHIIPWSKGGESVPDNLETKCKQCNLGKGNAFDV
ncbi:MAG: HNH endonuclease [Bacteroidales bacterium]|jgi:hypothetical protein|nr:HNH endonuclease [Bacteroidales bacterium]